MKVIPAINAPDFEGAKKQIEIALGFLPAGGWLHIDVGDGKFSSINTWSKPSDLTELADRLLKINLEVHLMTLDAEERFVPWLEAGVKRIVVHVEVLKDIEYLLEVCRKYSAEAGLAIAPETPLSELNVYLNKISFYQVLAVVPGKAGQQFNQEILEKARFLREQLPNAIIEVDGGINPETARLALAAGANVVASASYIFNSKNPAKAYQQLENI